MLPPDDTPTLFDPASAKMTPGRPRSLAARSEFLAGMMAAWFLPEGKKPTAAQRAELEKLARRFVGDAEMIVGGA